MNLSLPDCKIRSSPTSALPRPRMKGPIVWLSRDQKAISALEQRRITKAGRQVIRGRVQGLEPSRTLGDFDVKERVRPGVISIEPEVRRCEIGNGSDVSQALIVCCTDGVWDVL